MANLESLERRLERLEKKHRRVKALLAAACAFAVMPFLLAAAQKQEVVRARTVSADLVSAKEFKFKDDFGDDTLFSLKSEGVGRIGAYHGGLQLLASLSFTEYGPLMSVLTKDDKTAASMGVSENGGIVRVFGKDGKEAAQLYASSQGGVLRVLNPQKKDAAALYAQPDGGGRLNILGNDEKNAVILRAGQGGGELSLYSPKFLTVALGSDSDGGLVRLLNRSGGTSVLLDNGNGGQVLVLNAQEKIVGGLGVNPRGDGSFILSDRDGKMVGWLTTVEDGSSGGFQLRNPAGSVVFRAP